MIDFPITHLWSLNTPESFWQCIPDPPAGAWQEAIKLALPALRLPHTEGEIDAILPEVLGEAQFGAGHWQLSPARRLYYVLKPFLPLQAIKLTKSAHACLSQNSFPLGWPIETRYATFLWEVIRQLCSIMDRPSFNYRHIWPEGRKYAFVLTHDIETGEGQKNAHKIADLEIDLGFRSSFNFVPERYKLDLGLMNDLRQLGFEIGVHGLKHDGKLFSSQYTFAKRARRINHYLKEFDAVGFRSPLTHRNPYWMQALEIEYDLSFFDTDPYEPMPGGCMCIWPFIIGRFVELPYTLAQDCTLANVLGERTPQLWIQKVDFIERYCGMALLNAHPDYLLDPKTFDLYVDFLTRMRDRNNYWHALPREVARWWLKRINEQAIEDTSNFKMGTITIENGQIYIT